MTITLGPEHEKLIADAIQAGLIKSADEALGIAIDALRDRLQSSTRTEYADAWMQKFHVWATSHSKETPLLSDEAVGRESIYRERGL